MSSYSAIITAPSLVKEYECDRNTKDYTVAFGRLAGSYGLVGGVPSVPLEILRSF
ncbi:hypothetical protein BDQ17DRAFT_1382389, partial [Cyathus striatus]